MCQAFEGEQKSLFLDEREKLKQIWEDHKSGKKVLSEEELWSLAVRKLMLIDAGY